MLRDFLEIPYDELQELNLAAKAQRIAREKPEKVRELDALWTRQYEAARALALTDPAPEGAGKKGKKAKQ